MFKQFRGLIHLLFILIAIVFWTLDALYDSIFLLKKPILDSLIFDLSTAEVFQRIFVIICLILSSVLFDFYKRKYNEYLLSKESSENQLLRYAEDLEETLLKLKKYKQSFESIKDLIVVFNSNHICSIANPAFIQFFKLEEIDILNKPIELIITNLQYQNQIKSAINKACNGEVVKFETSFQIDSDQHNFFMTFYPAEDFNKESQNCIIIFYNITEQKKANRLKKMQDLKLEQANKMTSLGILSAGMAHEINNPNNSIMMNVSLLKRIVKDLLLLTDSMPLTDTLIGGFKAETINSKVEILLNGILNGSVRIKNITDELRNFARKETGTFEKVDINKILKSSIHLVDSLIKKKVGTLKLDPLETETLFIYGNFNRMQQVFINLLTNACESLPESKGSLYIKTERNQENNNIIIHISDTGLGIDPETLLHIKDPFFTTKRRSGGMGLGLSITSRIIDEHSGTLTISSEPDNGTRVSVSLPAWENKNIE